MSDVLVCDNESHPMKTELFERQLSDFKIDHAKLPSGSLNVTIDIAKYPLSSYRAMYIRVGEVTAEVLDAASNLEHVATCGSGYDHIDVSAATDRGVVVTHTPGGPAPGVIEHTTGLILALVHELPDLFEETAAGKWSEARRALPELRNKTVGVVGLGTIGSGVATAASETFACEVISYDPYVTGEKQSPIYPRVERTEMEARGVSFTSKQDLFERADVVTIHTPLSEETEGMVSYEELQALEDGYLINTSRGEVVDESALIDRREQLAGVALDVMDAEPPDDDNPLLGAPNVYVTPHVAGGTEGFTERSARINAGRIKATLRGDTPEGIVNPKVLS